MVATARCWRPGSRLQPVVATEGASEQQAEQRHPGQGDEVAIVELQLWDAGMLSKEFIPWMPATIVGTAAIATQAEILLMASFCCTPTWVRLASRAVCSRTRP